MTRKNSALTARTQLGQIMNRAVENNDRFLVERNGQPAVLILSVTDYVKALAPPPGLARKVMGERKAARFGQTDYERNLRRNRCCTS